MSADREPHGYAPPRGRLIVLGALLIVALSVLGVAMSALSLTNPGRGATARTAATAPTAPPTLDPTTDGSTPDPGPGAGVGARWWDELRATYTYARPAHLAASPVRSSTVARSSMGAEGGAVWIVTPLRLTDSIEAVALCEAALAFGGVPPNGLAVVAADGRTAIATDDPARRGRCVPGR